jgi:hypothetical protein
MKISALILLLTSASAAPPGGLGAQPPSGGSPQGPSAGIHSRREPPKAYWTRQRAAEVLGKTQDVRLAPDLSGLGAGEKRAVGHLLKAGAVFQRLYEESRHHQARAALADLQALDAKGGDRERTQALLRLYRLNQGPIATTLDNTREPFLPVDAPAPGKDVYPWGVTREELERFLAAHPEERPGLLHTRTVVRRATAANQQRDLAALRRHPVLDTLHPGLRARLSRPASAGAFYAVPYSVAYADEMVEAYGHLMDAAAAVEVDDAELAGYLRNRARDLLSNDYESGDAAWVTGRFKRLNAQIGAYETYDDELYGTKAFHALSLLLRDDAATTALRQAITGLQEMEDSLPYEPHKRVREDIPVGVYEVIADFGQARGTNTATILPNESYLARRYGRTILLRTNIMRNPDLFAVTLGTWAAAVAEPFEADLKVDGDFHRTLWHEIGHYLGVDRDRQGRELDVALQDNSAALEEMKADLVSLFLVPALRQKGYYDDERQRAVYASGIRRTLQNVKPRRDQPYQTMQLMQFNYFLEKGLLSWDPAAGALSIHYERYPETVAALLREVLEVQAAGDKPASDRFIERYTTWRDDLHGVLAANMRARQPYRFRLVRYAALGD